MKRLIKAVFVWIARLFGSTFKEAWDSIKDAKHFPLISCASLLVLSARIVAIATFAVALITFIVNNGYGLQIEIIKEYGLMDSLSKAATYGTSFMLTNGYSIFAWSLMLLLALLAIFTCYIISESGARRVVITVLGALVLLVSVLFLAVFKDKFFLVWTYLVFIAIILIPSFIVMSKSAVRTQIKQWLFTLPSVYVGLPLLLLIVQNLLALLATAIFYVVFGFVFLHIITAVTTKGEGSEGSTSGGGFGGGHSSARRSAVVKPELEPKVRDFDERLTLTRKERFDGYKYIEGNVRGIPFTICSQHDFDTGKVIIKRGKNKVNSI